LTPPVDLSIILYVLFEMDRAAEHLGACRIAIGIVYYVASVWKRRLDRDSARRHV
jgi:uncharacterized membrane protein YccC